MIGLPLFSEANNKPVVSVDDTLGGTRPVSLDANDIRSNKMKAIHIPLELVDCW